MEDNELKLLWQAYDRKLEQSLTVNLQLLKEVQVQKARTVLRTIALRKLILVALGFIWVLLLVIAAILATTAGNFLLLLCAVAIAGFNAYAIMRYINHIVMIQQINNSMLVKDTQERLASLQLSVLQAPRVLVLQLPFWILIFLPPGLLHSTIAWLIFMPLTISCTILAIWIYRKLNLKNQDKKWFARLYGPEGLSGIRRATVLLDEIKAFERK